MWNWQLFSSQTVFPVAQIYEYLLTDPANGSRYVIPIPLSNK